MKTFIVTGGLGFIGSNLIDLLISKNYKVINIDKVTYSSNFYNTQDHKKSKKYRFLKCDIKEKKLKKILFKYKPAGIFNLAAETHVDRSIDNPESFIQSNIVGVFNLLECFKEYSKNIKQNLLIFLLMKFMGIYSKEDLQKFMPTNPVHHMQQAKLHQTT